MSRYQVDMCEAPKDLSLNVTAAHHSPWTKGEGRSDTKALACYVIPYYLEVILQLCENWLMTTETSVISIVDFL